MGYDPKLDRLDVAIRGLIRLYRSARWQLLSEYGLTRKQHHRPLEDALLDIETLKTEKGVFALLRACPFLLPAAIEALRQYQQNTALSRFYHYAKRGGPQ